MLLPANQLIDIISSDELNVRSEEQVFNAVMAWVKYSIQERRPQLPQVRNSLRNQSSSATAAVVFVVRKRPHALKSLQTT